MNRDPRTSDEATGLPPLELLEQETTLVVLAWSASEGIAAHTIAGQSVDGGAPVRFLHCRGLLDEGDGVVAWAQIHIAVPVEIAVGVAAALAKGAVSW